MSRRIVEGILAAAVANAGTFTVSYPSGTTRGNFSQAIGHKLVLNNQVLSQPADIGLSFGASSVTVTNRTGASWAAGSPFFFQFEEVGEANPKRLDGVDVYVETPVVMLNLGAPATSDDDAVVTSAAIGGAGALTLNGASVASGVATFDVARNVIITNAGDDTGDTYTVTGTDAFGDTVVETITGANAGVAAGKKAFKTVTGVTASGASAGAVKIGFGGVLGLPVRLPSSANILKELQDGAAAVAGTVVAGLSKDTESTATTADVRGTYAPNAACDGSKAFALLCALPEPNETGNPQYGG